MTCIEITNPPELNSDENSETQTETSHTRLEYNLNKNTSLKADIRMINQEMKPHIKKDFLINVIKQGI